MCNDECVNDASDDIFTHVHLSSVFSWPVSTHVEQGRSQEFAKGGGKEEVWELKFPTGTQGQSPGGRWESALSAWGRSPQKPET